MKRVLKRIAAYLIDIILVSLIATFITSNPYINKDYNKYKKTYDEYSDKYDVYIEYTNDMEKYFDDKKITEKEYKKLLEHDFENENILVKYYEDEKITDKEYKQIFDEGTEYYSDLEIDYSFRLLKYSTIPTIVNLMCILLYFVVIQYSFNGQTLGKKLLKLRIVSNNKKTLTLLNYFIRSLIVNEVFINISNAIFLLVLSKNNYITYNQIIYVITYILEMTIMFTIVFDKNNRGLHDYLCNTKVIEE